MSASVNYAAIPQRLKAIPHWVVWAYETRDGKPTKPPFDAKQNGARAYAKTNEPETWASFEQAFQAADPLNGGDYEGLGVVFTDTDDAGIDLDGVVHEDGSIDPFAIAIMRLANSYCEYSPSGTGVHIIFETTLPLPEGNKAGDKKLGGEIYDETSPKYFTVTGKHIAGNPTTIRKIDDQDLVDLLHFLVMRVPDTKFTRLWTGDSTLWGPGAKYPSQSEADAALCKILGDLLNGDAQKVERYVNASGLGQRDKWRDEEGYRQRTIKFALAGHTQATSHTEPTAALTFTLPAVTLGTNYDFVIEPDPDQTDGWFPLGSPSLIGGASGSNKTTWMMDLLMKQERREVFLGHRTEGRPYLILMADRGEASHKRTMRRMRMDSESIPIKFLAMQMGTAALQEIVQKIEETTPLPQVVFIEGCDMLVEDANKKQIVGPFMNALQRIATHFHLAIVGSVGAPKCKAGEGYVAKRDNISGTEAWSRLAETVVLLQYPKGKDTVSERELTVLPRNAPAESFAMIMKKGRLERQTEADRQRAEGQDNEMRWAQAQARLAKTDRTKEWWTSLDMQRALQIPRTTAYRWLEHAAAHGHIVEKPGRKGRGQAALYHWNESQTNPLWIEHGDDDHPEQLEMES
jgi:putative DNA primase/helicase